MYSHIARAKLRRPTSVASVATNGGKRMEVISQAWSVPTRKPEASAAAMAQTQPSVLTVTRRLSLGSANKTMTRAQVVALKATMEPAERSMPPEMMTTAAPSAMMPSKTVLRRMMMKLDSKFVKYV